jgi:hypothetical protein
MSRTAVQREARTAGQLAYEGATQP